MNNYKVGDRAWAHGHKWIIVSISELRIDMIGKLGSLNAPLTSRKIKPILRVKNWVIYE